MRKRKGDKKMTFTITKKFMVRLENIESFPDLDIIYASDDANYLAIAKKIKEKFGGETKIAHISEQFHWPGYVPPDNWEIIRGTTNL